LLNQESTPSNPFFLKKLKIEQTQTVHVSTSVRALHLHRTKAAFALLLVPFSFTDEFGGGLIWFMYVANT
jgi:hypothetical protein